MTNRKRLRTVLVLLAVVPLLALVADYLISPSLVSRSDLHRPLYTEVLRYYFTQQSPGPIWIGEIKEGKATDFSEQDMSYWKASGYSVRPISALESSGLGDVQDRNTKEPGQGLVLKNWSAEGRATFKLDFIMRSGFCVRGLSVTLTRHLWGWTLNRTEPFYDF